MTYTYQCGKCGAMEDAQRKIADRDQAPEFCQACGSRDMARMFASGAGFVLQGPGWHKTDYNKTGRKKGM